MAYPSRWVALIGSSCGLFLSLAGGGALAHDAIHEGGPGIGLAEAHKAINRGEKEGARLARTHGWGEDRLCQAERVELGSGTDLATSVAARYGYLPGNLPYQAFVMSMRQAYGERFERERASCRLALGATSDRRIPTLPTTEIRALGEVPGGGATRADED